MAKEVVVIGSGVTGLTCALQLAKKGHQVHVFEKSQTCGGLAASYRSDTGFVFDYGPHEFCTNNPELVKLLEELLGEDLLVRYTNAAQYFGGGFLDYPAPVTHIFAKLNKRLLIRIGFEVIIQRFKRLVRDNSHCSFKHWVDLRFGPTLYRTYFGPYTKKVWGLNPDQLDSRTASSRISFNSTLDFVIKNIQHFRFKHEDFDNAHSPLKVSYYYSRGGIGTLIDGLVKSCEAAGVQFHFGMELNKLRIREGRADLALFANGKCIENFDYLISTIPLNHFLKSMDEFSEDATLLRFRAMVFVFLEVPKQNVSKFSWIYVPNSDISFQRITEFTQIDRGMAPAGHTGLCLEVACFRDDTVWRSSDNKLLQQARSELARMGLLNEDVPCRAHVIRVPFAYPVQFVGYIETIEDLLQPVRSLTNAVTTGRQGLFKYCNMNECMEMAIDVASKIDAGAKNFELSVASRWRGAGLDQESTLTQ